MIQLIDLRGENMIGTIEENRMSFDVFTDVGKYLDKGNCTSLV